MKSLGNDKVAQSEVDWRLLDLRRWMWFIANDMNWYPDTYTYITQQQATKPASAVQNNSQVSVESNANTERVQTWQQAMILPNGSYLRRSPADDLALCRSTLSDIDYQIQIS